jgi:hypothetical protein
VHVRVATLSSFFILSVPPGGTFGFFLYLKGILCVVTFVITSHYSYSSPITSILRAKRTPLRDPFGFSIYAIPPFLLLLPITPIARISYIMYIDTLGDPCSWSFLVLFPLRASPLAPELVSQHFEHSLQDMRFLDEISSKACSLTSRSSCRYYRRICDWSCGL